MKINAIGTFLITKLVQDFIISMNHAKCDN